MKLRPAPGSPEMQDALLHPFVHKIVDILVQVIDENFFKYAVLFLKTYNQRTQPRFTEDLQALRAYASMSLEKDELFVTPTYVDELIQTLVVFYEQNSKVVGFQRGAIVELLATELVCPRYKSGECADNQSFHDEKSPYRSSQVDVAVLSHEKEQIEGYTCKIKADRIESADCTNLTALADMAERRDYRVHVGVVSFDNTRLIKSKIEGLPLTRHIDAYGADNFSSLRESPFK